jgi:Fe-S-cluster containining protein
VVGKEDLARSDAELLRVLDGGFDEAGRRAGTWLACRPGCSECCIGPFPVTRLDVWRLRRGLADLAREEPDRAGRIADRAREAALALADGYPGDPGDGTLVDDVDALDLFFERHGSLPCPVLDPESGRCELYEVRPVSCRTYGPPLRFLGEDAPPCPLCFDGAEGEVVERCRFEPDPRGLEGAILSKMGVPAGSDWETLIPFALLHEDRARDSGREPS